MGVQCGHELHTEYPMARQRISRLPYESGTPHKCGQPTLDEYTVWDATMPRYRRKVLTGKTDYAGASVSNAHVLLSQLANLA
jgi:hypothetical protein